MSSDQEKILLLQKEFHLSQLRLKECGVELQKIKARLLQDLLDLEISHHASERKAYDMQMAQLKDQINAARTEMEQIKLTKVAPLKPKVARAEYVSNKDVLSSSFDDAMPTVAEGEDIEIMDKEDSAVITASKPSLQQEHTTASVSETASIPSDKENTIRDSQGNTCIEQVTEESQSMESVTGLTETAVELKSPENDVVMKVKKNLQNRKNEDEIPVEVTVESIPSTGDGVSVLVEFQSEGDTNVCEDMETDIQSSVTKPEEKFGVGKCTEEDSGLDKHNCQQCVQEETINSLPFEQTVIEKQHDEDVPLRIIHTCHSTTSKNDATLCEEVEDHVAVEISECIVMTSPLLPAEDSVTIQTDGLNPSNVNQQTCEENAITHKESIPVKAHDNQTPNCNDESLLPNTHEESASSLSQDVICGAALSEPSGGQNGAEKMNVQETDVTTMKLEAHQNQKSVKKKRKKKGVSRKKKGRSKLKKPTNMASQALDNMTDQVEDQGTTVPDSTADCSIGLVTYTENTQATISNSGVEVSPEPSVSSTSNRAADDTNMECSSNYKRATLHDDEECVTVKKLKLEDNPITSPGNLVTSTSSDNVGNVEHNTCTLVGDDNTMSRPLTIAESDTVASTTDKGNSSINGRRVPTRGTGKPRGINRRKCTRPMKRQIAAMATVTKRGKVNPHEESVEANNGDVNHTVTNAATLVDTTDAIQERTQDKSILKPQQSVRQNRNETTPEERKLETSPIKFEPEAHMLGHTPVTKSSKESSGVKAHGQKATLNKQRKLLSLKSLNSRLMPNTSFHNTGDMTSSSIVFNLHNITAPKLKASVKPTLK